MTTSLSASTTQEFPLMVGGHAHGAENIRVLSDLGLGNFVWIPKKGYPLGNVPWDDKNDILVDIDECVKLNMYFMISQRRGLGKEFKPGGYEYGGDTTPEIHSKETVNEIVKRAGNLFAGLHAEELDCDFVQNAIRITSRTRNPELFNFTDRQGGRLALENELARLKNIYHGYGTGVNYWPNMCVTQQHSGFRIGADLVIAELMESLPTTELQLAYLRGGSQQFSIPWGMWVSPWHNGGVPSEDKELWKSPMAHVGGGHAASTFRRCLYLSYVSNARVLSMQETEPLFSKKNGKYVTAVWGVELKKFWDYAKNHREPFTPIISFALLVDKNNGWAPANIWAGWTEHESVWGKLPVDRSDLMLSAYLDVLLPGYGHKMPGYWKSGLTYPGHFTATPAGPFDIVSSDISADKLACYESVMLMGDVEITPELLQTLKTYVKNGGNLYINTNQARCNEAFVQDEELFGATIGMKHEWSGWSNSDLLMRRIYAASKIVVKQPVAGVGKKSYSEPWFVVQDVQVKTAEIIADDGAGNPILTRNKYGNGYAYLSTPEYMMEGYGDFTKPLTFFKSLVAGLNTTGKVKVTMPGYSEPQEDISWVAAYQGHNEVVVLVVNHDKESRKDVDVTWNQPGVTAKIEVGMDKLNTKTENDKTIFNVTVDPEDVVVLRIFK
jgi:hypothetical protein